MAQKPIDASAIPVPTLDAATLTLGAGWLKNDATDIRGRGADVKSSWGGLAAVYHAPEDVQLFAVMDPVAVDTDSFATDLETVAGALQTFAEVAGPLQQTLASTQSAAAAFATKVSGNGKWDHDSSLVKENNDMVDTVNTTICAFQAAERTAANAIEAVIGGQQWHAANPKSNAKDPYAYGYDSIPNNAKTPWGADVQKKSGCFKNTMSNVGGFFVGVGKGAWGLVKGVGTMLWDGVGLGGWDKFKATWEGIGFLGMILNPMEWPVALATYGPKGTLTRLEAMGKGLVDWDDWKNHPGQAAGETFFNVVTLAIPGADVASGVGDAAKGAEAITDATEAAGNASKLAKAADVAKTAANVFAKYTDPFTYLGKLPKVLDLANGFKVKFPDFAGIGTKAGSDLDQQMAAWDHDGAGVGSGGHDGGGDYGGSGTHDGGGNYGGSGSHDGSGTSGTHDGSGTSGTHDGSGTSGTHDGSGTSGTHGGSGINHPAAGLPTKDAANAIKDLPRDDPAVQAQVQQVHSAVQPHLQDAADEAWKEATNTDSARYQAFEAAHDGRAPSAGVIGTWAHSDLSAAIKADGDKLVPPGDGYRLRSEQSYNSSGEEVRSGAPDSVRPDLVLERRVVDPDTGDPTWEVAHVWDLKTGNARITNAWATKVSNYTGVDKANIEVLRPTP